MADASRLDAGALAARPALAVPKVQLARGPEIAVATPLLPGAVGGGVRILLRAEGLAILALAMAVYGRFGGDWGFFALTFLLPDLALLAYLAGPRAGAGAYNLAHSLLVPVGLLALGLAVDWPPAFDLALVWAAHIGLDRALGFGLKYSRGFIHTHLGRLGPADPW